LDNILNSEELDLDSDSSYSYVWVEDKHFTYPEPGADMITISSELCCCDQIVVQLFNFRKEMLMSWVFNEGAHNMVHISPEESLKLHPGIYYLNVHIETNMEEATTYLKLTNTYEI
jgi:hypothetical protein